jgi:hypothetical protein
VTAPIGASGTEFQDIAKKVASVDTLDAFLRDLSARYPEASAAPPAGAAVEGSSPAAESEAKPTTNGAGAGPATRTEPDNRNAASSPLPPNAPAGVPLKPDKEPTGSISRRITRATAR